MADTVYYNMGQIRYNKNESEYNSEQNIIATYYNREDAISGLNFRDILFKFNNDVTDLNSVYCLDLKIPRNRSYNMIFDLLLVQQNNNDGKIDLNNYQFVRKIKVLRESINDLETSTVVLYPPDISDPDNVKVGIVRKILRGGPAPDDSSFVDTEDISTGDFIAYYADAENKNLEYYVKTSNRSFSKVNRFNDTSLPHSWNQGGDVSKENFKIVFSKKVPSSSTRFNCLLLMMKREGFEADIRYTQPGEGPNGTDQTYYGLSVDEDDIECACYELNNWISSVSTGIIPNIPNGILSNIGVWSHPDSIMAINGEEIRIGQSGYYELNNFDISHFSMLIRDENDKFSMDYQYKLS